MNRIITVMLLSFLFCTAVPYPSDAGEWIQVNGHWRYDFDDRMWPENAWVWIDGNRDGISECYYFDEYGNMASDCRTPDGYYVNADGCWVVDGVVQTMGSYQEPGTAGGEVLSESSLVRTIDPEANKSKQNNSSASSSSKSRRRKTSPVRSVKNVTKDDDYSTDNSKGMSTGLSSYAPGTR